MIDTRKIAPARTPGRVAKRHPPPTLCADDTGTATMADLMTTAQRGDLLGSPLPRRAGPDRGAGRPAVAGGPDGPVDARREPDQVAPGPHRPGSSRPSCSSPDLRGLPARSTPRSATSSTRTTRASGPGTPGPSAGVVSRPGIAEVGRVPRPTSTRPWSGSWPARSTPDVLDLVELGLQHEQQHQELLLMDIKHVLSRNPLQPAYTHASTGRHGRRGVTPRRLDRATTAGRSRSATAATASPSTTSSPVTASTSSPFALADRPVTCGEWLAFIDDGGYERPELWLSDGWATVQAEGWDAPLYWCRRSTATGGVFTLGGAPGRPGRARLPRQLLRGRRLRPLGRGPPADRGGVGGGRRRTAGGHEGNVLDLDRPAPRRPTPADGRVASSATSGSGPRSAYSPYPGFRPPPGAVGEYNGKFMVNQYVLRGGSCVTPPDHVRATYRNFFPAVGPLGLHAACAWPDDG